MSLRIDVVSIFPQFVRQVAEYGVTGRALQRGLLQLETWNPRDFTSDAHRTVDDKPYGGGPGMVMKLEPLLAAVAAARKAADGVAQTIYLSPQGRPLDHQAVRLLSSVPRLILVAGRYEGIDERLIAMEVDAEYSIGDYVLSGGELPAMVLIDAVARLVPGVLGDAESAQQDSFVGSLLDHPHYTRPEVYADQQVPAVLLSGDHAAIARWRRMQALGRTWTRRPDLLANAEISAADRILLDEYQRLNSK